MGFGFLYNPDEAAVGVSECNRPEIRLLEAEPEAAPASRSVAVNYAGIGWRALSLVIDSCLVVPLIAVAGLLVLLMAAVAVVCLGLDPVQYGPGSLTSQAISYSVSLGLPVVLHCLYYTVLESSSWQATPGKRLLGMTVADQAGSRISPARAFARYWGKLLSAIFYPGILMAVFTKRKQALHDWMAGCVIIQVAREPRGQ